MLERHDNPEKQRWLPGARLNIAECALTGWDPDAPALVWAAEDFPNRLHSLTLDQLRRRCYAFAASLCSCGYRPGDGRDGEHRSNNRADMSVQMPPRLWFRSGIWAPLSGIRTTPSQAC